jgi:hypothetical protein
LGTSQAEAGVSGVQGNAEGDRHLGDGHFVDVVQDENGARLEAERFEGGENETLSIDPLDVRIGRPSTTSWASWRGSSRSLWTRAERR